MHAKNSFISQGLDYKLKSDETEDFKLYSIYNQEGYVGHIIFAINSLPNLRVESLIINEANKGYGTKILREACWLAKELGSESVVLNELLEGAYGLTLNDRFNIFKKIGNALKKEGLVKKVFLNNEPSIKQVIYEL